MLRRYVLWVCVCGAMSAAPTLRLTNTAVFAQVAAGANTQNATLDAFNIGDGSLSLAASTPPSVTWLAVSIGAAHECSPDGRPRPCIPLQFTMRTASLARGIYTAEVTIADPAAIDAPQAVTVTVQVGAAPALTVDRWLAPGQFSDSVPIAYCGPFVRDCPSISLSTGDGGRWLSVAQVSGSTLGSPRSYAIHLAPPSDIPPGTYHGSVSVNGSESIPITMRVTTQPIAAPSLSQISLRLAQGGPAVTYPFLPGVALRNTGFGTLTIEDATATGAGVSVQRSRDLVVVSVDPGNRPPGLYSDGSITIRCNAANCPLQVPVSVEIVPKGPPLIYYRGVVDNAAFVAGDAVAQGDVMIVKGEQLSFSAPAFASAPLPSILGGARVLVNGVAAPLFYSSSGQIAFQMPSGTAIGTALVQIERDGQLGNTVSVDVTRRAPRIVVITAADYSLRDAAHPARPGEVLVIWAIGLGPTAPAVPDGAGAPASPLAVITDPLTVSFSNGRNVAPSFAGLSPGAVGLYQVNIQVPADMPTGFASIQLSGSYFATFAVQ